MNIYETIIIFEPHVEKSAIDFFAAICQAFTGSHYEIDIDDLGLKKLAYEIKSHKEGYYVVFTWAGTTEDTAELERQMRVNDNVIKFITVKKDIDDDYHLKEKEDSRVDISAGRSEQIAQPDALDVLFGMAEFVKKES